ncbi:MAG TPA: glycosyl hydrolase [Bacteroidales bacterium]|nr:glycosyl hydrolase [Bacteroidales bacterium]
MNLHKYLLPFLLALFVFSCVNIPDNPRGYPEKSENADILKGFRKPPEGFGEVPFYWWQGDTLTRERLLWQLDRLTGKGISSLQINYSHLDYGSLSYGLSNPSKPALFTDAWWDLFKWFAEEASKRGMSVSLSDYTIGIGQGFSMDEALKNNPEINGSVLRCKSYIMKGRIRLHIPENILALTAYNFNKDSTLIPESRADLLRQVNDSELTLDLGNSFRRVIIVYPEKLIPSYDPMHPESGKAYNEYFFGKFEKALQGKGKGSLNFFFSDELNFRVSGNLWNDYFAEEFSKRKGYRITDNLDALFFNTGDKTSDIRLDYNDVLVSLCEENFFKPVYQWHQDRGMIFGCDHGGRGLDVAEFGDYFRTQRWNQGPGSDQPYLSKDIVKAKVAASIAHLYERPRVWLEGFYSSGWGTSSAALTDAIFANYVAGYNLMSFHGLYYSTMGGWWEWAPPDNHFRMPYWLHIDPLMKSMERLSYLLSQGVHKCDVAIIYPTEPVVAGVDGDKAVKTAFETGEDIYRLGIDFDFIDYESLARCEVKNKELLVAGEHYKVLIVPAMNILRNTSLQKIEEFSREGGIVVFVGDKPENLFTPENNILACQTPADVSGTISGRYNRDFIIYDTIHPQPYVMHRTIGSREVFALYNIPEGTKCFFRTKGNVQLWDPWTGKTASLEKFAGETAEGTVIELPLSEKEIQLIVFNKKNKKTDNIFPRKKLVDQISVDSKWQSELEPVLDNRWGDYQLPAKDEMLGAQVRQLRLTENNDSKVVTCSYGPQFLKLGPLLRRPSPEKLIRISKDEKTKWEAYSFSWRYGVEGDYGHQGWHGLKGRVYDQFIRLGAIEERKMSKFRVAEKEGIFYILKSSVIAPYDGEFGMHTDSIKPALILIENNTIDPYTNKVLLKKGANQLLLLFERACTSFVVFRDPKINSAKAKPVAMRWFEDPGILPFDCPESNSGIFSFRSAPGLISLSFSAYGKVSVKVNGESATESEKRTHKNGISDYRFTVNKLTDEPAEVEIAIEYQPGYRGAGAFPGYIEQECGKGSLLIGDWSEVDGLHAYSGGMWYRKTINIDKKVNELIEIDLGNVVSSAELLINGKSAGIRLSPPWSFDITANVRNGENKIEILVLNTVSNNYTSIPTRYRGSIRSGLIGPVSINTYTTDKD